MNKSSLIRVAGFVAVTGTAAIAVKLLAQDEPPPPPPAASDQAVPPPPPPPVVEEAPPQSPPTLAEQPMLSIELPPGLSHSQVQSAILAALQHRDWTVVSTGDHTVVGHLLHHHVDATVTFSYNRGRVDLYSTSYLVGHHAEDRIMAFTREDWIRNLRHDILYYVQQNAP